MEKVTIQMDPRLALNLLACHDYLLKSPHLFMIPVGTRQAFDQLKDQVMIKMNEEQILDAIAEQAVLNLINDTTNEY